MPISRSAQSVASYRHFDYSGGLNNRDHPAEIADNECSLLRNGRIDVLGQLSKRMGCQKLNSVALASQPVTKLYRFYRKDGTKYRIAFCNGELSYVSDLGVKTSIATGLDTTNIPTIDTANDLLIFTNAIDAVKKWDTSAFAALGGSPPKAKFVKAHKNRVFLAGDPANPSRLSYSDLAAPESWPANNYIDVPNAADSDIITGLARIFDNLVIFKTRSTYILHGTDAATFQLRRVDADFGCIAPYSIVEAMGFVYFLSMGGYARLEGTTIRVISDKIRTTVNNVNMARLSQIVGVHYHMQKRSHWYAPDGASTTNNIGHVYWHDKNAWEIDNGLAANMQAAMVQDGPGDMMEFFTGAAASSGFIYQQEMTDADDGAAIDFRWEDKERNFGLPERDKRFRLLFPWFKPTGAWNVLVEAAIDGASFQTVGNQLVSAGALWGVALWGVDKWGGSRVRGRFVLPFIGRTFKLAYSNNAAGQPVTVQEFTQHFRVKALR